LRLVRRGGSVYRDLKLWNTFQLGKEAHVLVRKAIDNGCESYFLHSGRGSKHRSVSQRLNLQNGPKNSDDLIEKLVYLGL